MPSSVNLPAAGNYVLTVHGASGAYAFQLQQISLTSLTLGTPYTGNLTGSGQSQFFTFNEPIGQVLSIHLSDSAASDHVELYARFGAPPTQQTYDYGANGTGASQNLLVPSATAGTWWVLVYAESVASAPSSFTLQADASPVVLTSVTPIHFGANSTATLTVNGSGFTNTTAVALVASNGTVYPASSTTFDTFTQLTATINLAGVPQGTYSVRVTNADGSDILAGAFTVTAPGQADLQTHIILPATLGRHASSTIYVQYSNTGSVAMAAPVLLIESSVADDKPLLTLNPALQVGGFWTSAVPQGYSNTVEILASGKVPGLLEPGESVTVPVYYAGMQTPWNFNEPQFHFDLRVFTTTDTDMVDWGFLQSSLQPAGITNAAWAAIYGNLTSQLGNTWGGYVQFLDGEASYLGQLGENVTDIGQLWGAGVQQANNALTPVGPTLTSATDDAVVIPGSLSLSFSRVFSSSITGRNTLGPLGYGWSTPWQTTAITSSDGTVTVTGANGAERIFQPDSRTVGAFFSEPGDTGTLKSDGQGGYMLTEADGTETDYNPNGTLNYLQDTNGNRITAGYTSGLLTSLTASSGQSITISYNSLGLISTVSDSDSRTTSYSYGGDLLLISVTSYNGEITSYTYGLPSLPGIVQLVTPQLENILSTITYPGGTHQYFTYDSEGRIASTYNDGGAQTQTFSYTLGQVSVTDGTGDTSHLYYNEQGLVVKSIDPLGNVTLNSYDSNFNLIAVTNALGQSETYTYNGAGEMTSCTDFLGDTTSFAYAGPFNELLSMIDANGNKTTYAYSSSGELLSTTYANGTSSSSTYNPEGDATSFLNANGQPIAYTYNAAGQILTETFSDGSKYSYTYDSFGDLLTATDSSGTTTFNYDPTTDLLTKVLYPTGMYLTFTYNTAGQRTSMVDQTGFTTNYIYDSVGRLSELTDGSGNMIVIYTYDANGRLSLKTNGNGTYTTYQYDADGNILHLINYAPDGTINSRFDYTYNALGLETTEATLDGTWTYNYDGDGQLIHAVFASTNVSVPSQDLAYSYDAMGNRITTVINGVTTAYITNNVNEYTSVGGVAYQYDADGNLLFDGTNSYTYNSLNQLISVNGPSGTTTYTYNALGQRISSITNGQETQYLIDPAGLGNVVGTYTGTGNLIADYVYGLGLTSQVASSGDSYYDFDAVGNVVGTSNSSGAYTNQYVYLPFSGTLSIDSSSSNPFEFAGLLGVMTDATGLAFARARYYSFSAGRFASRDPIGLASGDTNPYRYAINEPLTNVDPSGFYPTGISPTGTLDFLPLHGPIDAVVPDGYPAAAYFWNGVAQMTTDVLVSVGVGAGVAYTIEQGSALATSPYWAPAYYAFSPSEAGIPGFDDFDDPPSQYRLPLPLTPPNGFQGDGYYPPTPSGFQEYPPTPPYGIAGAEGGTNSAASQDPNAVIGPAGYGTPNFVADSDTFLPYQIDFENAATATAPAQDVTITDQLDPNLDWSTFQLTGIAWADTILSIPAGSQHYESTVSMTYNGETFEVLVEAGIHTATGQVYVTFQSIDPNTELPPNVLTGFLPPEDGTGRGIGYISFMIEPKSGLPTGTQIRNVALVTFDENGAISTDQVNDEDPSQGVDPTKQALVTINSVAPTSSVAVLPAVTTTTNFTVNWSGTDDTGGSGVGTYSIFVSDNGSAFTPWLTNTTQTSATYIGTDGHTYAFYSMATDNVGNVQPTPSDAQATTTVDASPPTSSVAPLPQFSPGNFTVNWSGTDANGIGIASYTIFVSDNGAAFTPWLTDTTLTTATYSGVNGHTYGFYSIATDNLGNQQLPPPSAQASTTVDSVAPSSSVAPLPIYSPGTFSVTWFGSDNAGGSGLANVSVYVSDNGSVYTPWLTNTTSTSASYTGADGHTYTFYSIATDNVGNIEPTPTTVEAETTVASSVAAQFAVVASPSEIAGQSLSYSVTALAVDGTLAALYTGTVQFTSSDGQASLPANYAFTNADDGKHNFTVALETAGNQTVTVTDAAASTVTASATVAVSPAAASSFTMTGLPTTNTAGTPDNFTVTAYDRYGNIAAGYTGTVDFSSTDAQAFLPSDYTFVSADSGSHLFSATLKTSGTQTLSVMDSLTSGITGSGSVTVTPATAASLSVIGVPNSVTAGNQQSFTVTALDAYGNVATGYNGTVGFTSTDGQAVLPPNYTFATSDNGSANFLVALDTAGLQSLTATDKASASITGSESSISVNPATANTFIVTGFTSPVTAGTVGTLTVTALDSFGNTATDYTGTVHLTSTDASAALPANYQFTAADGGQHAFSVTLKTAGSQGLTVTDTATATLTGTQTDIVVNPAAVATLTVAGFPSLVMAGVAGNFIVTALDAYGNVATSYTGTVHFTSSDTTATLPANYRFVSGDAGTHTFSATLNTANTQSITATDTVTSSILGTQTGIVVTAATTGTVMFSVTGFATPTTAGVAHTFTVTALTKTGAVDTAYVGTIQFTSSDPHAQLPANYTFTAGDAGSHTFTATLKTAGVASLTATDTSRSSVTGTESAITVNAGTVIGFVVTGYPSATVAGLVQTFTVTAVDAYDNRVTSYRGKVSFSSTDSKASLPGSHTFTANDAGQHVFHATLKTADTQSISVTDTTSNTLTGTESGIAVTAAAARKLLLGGYPSSTTAGVAHSFTVTAVDAYGNVATGYTGTVHLTSNDGQAVLPTDYMFTAADAGVYTFTVALDTAGKRWIEAADTVTHALAARESGIQVQAAAARQFQISAPTKVKAGAAFMVKVTALDAYGNVVTGYVGTIHFTSTDGLAELPLDYTFTAVDAGVHKFSVTMKTEGVQSLTATDTKNSTLEGTDSNITVG